MNYDDDENTKLRSRKNTVKDSKVSRHLQRSHSGNVKGVMQELHTPQPGGRYWFSCPILAKFDTNDLYSMSFWKAFIFFQNFEI